MIYLLKLLLATLLIVASCTHYVPSDLKTELTGAGIVFFADVLLLDFGSYLHSNWKRFLLIVRCKYLSLSGKYIRFSMAYQYRIKVNDKYLLVKNSNWDFYQHVGGKYKRLPHTQHILKEFESKDDLILKTTGIKKDDLAVLIPAKNAIRFLDWFNTGENREISHWREFYEELIGGNKVLPQSVFPYVNYDFVKSIRTPLKWSTKFKCNEILQYDVLDLIPTQKQQLELEKLFNKGDSEYIKWANDELIQNLGYDCHTQKKMYEIGAHTKWVLNSKWSKD
jgi:hypothetical protein